ncbi:unnamed protein product [Closterium sp. NIES-53]
MTARFLDSPFFGSVVSQRAPFPADRCAAERVPAPQPARPPPILRGRPDRSIARPCTIPPVCAAHVVALVWFDDDVDDQVDDPRFAGWEGGSSAGGRAGSRGGRRGENAEQAGARATRRKAKDSKRGRGNRAADVDREGEQQGSRVNGDEGMRLNGSTPSTSSTPFTGKTAVLTVPATESRVLAEAATAAGIREAVSTPAATGPPAAAPTAGEGAGGGGAGAGAAARASWFVADGASSAVPPSSSFVKPLSTLYPRVPCRVCQDTKLVECACCDGVGTLARGGFQKKNPVSVSRIIGSKWTAMVRTHGWHHFRVESKRRMGGSAGSSRRGAGMGEAETPGEKDVDGAGNSIIVWKAAGDSASSPGLGSKSDWLVEMVATCDPSTRVWVNAHNLKNRRHWAMGWLQKEELQALDFFAANAQVSGLGAGSGVDGGSYDGLSKRLVCKACQGQGKVACPRCKELAEMREKERERRRNEGGRDGFDDDFQDDGLLEIIQI